MAKNLKAVLVSREAQRKAAAKRIAADEDLLKELDRDEAVETAEPKAPPVCVFCGQPSKAYGPRGGFAIVHTIGGIRGLCHNQSSSIGEGCHQLYTRAKVNVMGMRGAKVGQHGRYNKPLCDRLLVEECARMMAMPKHRSNVADQFKIVGMRPKTAEQVRLDKLEAALVQDEVEFVENDSDYQPPSGNLADQVIREKNLRDERDSKKHPYVTDVPGSEGQ